MAAARANDAPHYIVSTLGELPCADWGLPFSVEIAVSGAVRRRGIAADAFNDCSGLISVIFPEGVKKIGECAFRNCRRLTSVTLPKSLKVIGPGAFFNCSALSSIVLPEALTEIKGCAFTNCIGLTSIDVPERVIKMDEAVFSGCSWLVVITMRCAIRPVPVLDFHRCDHLTLVMAPQASALVGRWVGKAVVEEDTAANRRRALDLQYWRVSTHWLCSPPRRSWVFAVLIIANRLLGGPLALPREMWYMILSDIRRCELGPAPCPVVVRYPSTSGQLWSSWV
jgi:hypothetical protein